MLFSSKVNGKLVLILEIQSSLVRGSLAWMTPGKENKPQVIFSDSVYIPYKPNVDTSYFVKLTVRALHETVEAAERKLYTLTHDAKNSDIMPDVIEEIHYVLSSPWVVSQARTVSVNFESNTTITQEKINKVLANERATLSKGDDGILEPIEEKVFDVRLNGYSLDNWHGKEAKNVEISYAITLGSADSMKRLREIAQKMVHGSKVSFHSSLLLQYIALHAEVMPERSEYTLIHVHGELTDVVVVEKGSCTFFGSYPVGVNTIVRKIAKTTGTDDKTADSLLSLYLGNKLDEDHAKETATIINDISAGWNAELNHLFKDHRLATTLPLDTFLGARAHEELFHLCFASAHPNARISPLAVDDVTICALAIHSML